MINVGMSNSGKHRLSFVFKKLCQILTFLSMFVFYLTKNNLQCKLVDGETHHFLSIICAAYICLQECWTLQRLDHDIVLLNVKIWKRFWT